MRTILGFILLTIVLGLFAQDIQPPTMTEEYKAALIDSMASVFDRVYIFPEKGKDIADALRMNLKAGAYSGIEDPHALAQKLGEDVLKACEDKHLAVYFDPRQVQMIRMEESKSGEEQRIAYEQQVERERKFNFGFNQMEILRGNVAYLRFDRFSGLPEAYPVAIAAMNFVSHCDGLIIDLRYNGGGSAYMIQLISSYLTDEFKDPVHLNTFYHRASDTSDQTWTLPYVPGKRIPDVPVYLLTSNYTFSAAEEFTYNLKNNQRVTIVGETTGGGAHPVTFIPVDDWFVAKVPNGRAINPISKTNWEGTGIAPDIEAPADEAKDIAYESILTKLKAESGDPIDQFMYEWVLDGMQLEDNQYTLSKRQMKSFTGTYGPRTIRYRDGKLYYQRTGPEYALIPYKEDHFMLEGLEYFRIRFDRDENGNITSLVGLYDDGGTDMSPKTN